MYSQAASSPGSRQQICWLAPQESMDVDQRPWIDRPQGAAVSLSWGSGSWSYEKVAGRTSGWLLPADRSIAWSEFIFFNYSISMHERHGKG
jgi:hypothetical protein